MLHMSKLDDKSDPDKFFTAFEKLATVKNIARYRWVDYIVDLLQDKYLDLFINMPRDKICDYEEIKRVMLANNILSDEQLRQKFRQMEISEGESYVEFAVRLRYEASKWLEKAGVLNDATNMFDYFVLEQFRNKLSVDMKKWLCEKDVQNVEQAAKIVDRGLQMEKELGLAKQGVDRNTNSELLPNNYSFPGTGTPTSRDNAPEQKQDWGKACDYCGKLGHNVGNCFRKNGFPNRLIGSLGRSRFGNNTYRGFGRPGLGYHNTNLGHAEFRPNTNTLT